MISLFIILTSIVAWTSSAQISPPVVSVVVGGQYYVVAESTLTLIPYFQSALNHERRRLDSLRSGPIDTPRFPIFVDRDGGVFRYILHWLRSNQLPSGLDTTTLSMLQDDADFYQLSDLAELVTDVRRQMKLKPCEESHDVDDILAKAWSSRIALECPIGNKIGFDLIVQLDRPETLREFNSKQAYGWKVVCAVAGPHAQLFYRLQING